MRPIFVVQCAVHVCQKGLLFDDMFRLVDFLVVGML